MKVNIDRPSHNEIRLSIGGASVSLGPEDITALIEGLANARFSMQPELPRELSGPTKWLVTTEPDVHVVDSQEGARLVIFRHAGYGFVPFTISQDAAQK